MKYKSWPSTYNTLTPKWNRRRFLQTNRSSAFTWHKLLVCLSELIHFVSKIPNDIKSLLVQVMAWRRAGDKPLPELLLTQCTDAYMHHHGSPTPTLRNNDVFITSKWHHFDVITTKSHRFEVIATLLLRHVFSGPINSTSRKLCTRFIFCYVLWWIEVVQLSFTHHMIFPVSVINSLWPSDAIWRHIAGSTLVQVMACCLTATSHYLN